MTTTAQENRRKEWVAALRSGKYKQGNGKLCLSETETYSYCCLGVACDLFKAGKGVWEENKHYSMHFKTPNGAIHTVYPPSTIQDELGLTTNDGCFDIDGLSPELRAKLKSHGVLYTKTSINKDGMITSLAALNDTGVPFDIIADVIEEEPVGLFK